MLSCVWGVQGALMLPEAQGLTSDVSSPLQPSRILCGAKFISRPGSEDLFPLFRWKKDAGKCCLLALMDADARFLRREVNKGRALP